MRQIRIFVEQPLSAGAEVALGARAAEHVARVLRMRRGDSLLLFNGDGKDYQAVLTASTRREAVARIGAAQPAAAESPLRLVLAQALLAGNKMDLVIQKAVELGVEAIMPLRTERCSVRLDRDRAARRLEHWRAVIIGACEQSGRARLPPISPPCTLPVACEAFDAAGLRLLLVPGATQRPRDLPTDCASATLVVGPEGGLTAAEIALLCGAGFRGLALGPRILRTETAGLAALAALQARCGDL